jgi:hypothetical protein
MFIFGSISLVYMLIAFQKLNKLSKTFHLIETQKGLIAFYITNFAFVQVTTLVYGVMLPLINKGYFGNNKCVQETVIQS